MESKIQVPLIRNPESSSLNPEPPLIPEFKIVLDYLTWGDGSPPPGGGGGRGVTQLYTGFVPFFEQKIQVLYISHFSRTPSVQKSAWSLCIC